MNYRLVAIEVGDLLKYDTSVNQNNRTAGSVLIRNSISNTHYDRNLI